MLLLLLLVSTPKKRSISLPVTEISLSVVSSSVSRCPVAVVQQINGLQVCSDGVAGRFVCFLYLGSSTCVVFPGGGGMRFLFHCFCERVGFFYGIPNYCGVGGGWWLFRPLVLWSAVVDLCSTPVLHKLAADGRSSTRLRLGASRRRFLRPQ
jgi:hypothetical protein